MNESVTKETRQKFDMLLKEALNKKCKTKSKESLISEKSSNAAEEDTQLTCTVDVHENHKSYILTKFLNDTELHKTDEDSINSEATYVKVKVPVPKPRKHRNRRSSFASNDTYKVEENSKTNSISNTCSAESKNYRKQDDSDADINTRSDSSISRSSARSRSVDKIAYENELRDRINKKESKTKAAERTKVEPVALQDHAKFSYDQIMAIIVHRTGFLKLQSVVIHPIVKIHIVNESSGQYLKKTDENRSIIFHYDDKNISYIQPILTQPYDLQKKRMLYPMWEETILVNEDFSYILNSDTKAMLFFELIDFMTFSTASAKYSQRDKSNGWHKIAWAFLKIVGKNNSPNIKKKLRLQLYVPYTYTRKNHNNVCEPYLWWKRNRLQKYPSTLYVTVKGINSHMLLDTFSLKHRKLIRPNLCDDLNFNTANDSKDTLDSDQVRWDKLLHKKCNLPNEYLGKLDTYDEGCFVAKFSHSGRYLAYSVLLNSIYTLIVYNTENSEETHQFPGHQNLIYCICWSADDATIATASADGSVCLWSVKDNEFLQMLPHPSFVYCVLLDANSDVITTGCYDQILRIWERNDRSEYIVNQELKVHKGYITSICSNKNGDVLFSSDSVGVICQWQRNEEHELILRREIIILEIKNVVINNLKLHKREKRLLIHTRANNLCLFNLKSGFVIHWLQNYTNKKLQVTSCFSNCGTYVFAGTENNTVNVWNAYTGKLVASYYPYNKTPTNSIAIHCVDFHPKDDVLCIAHYGKKLPVVLCIYDPDLKGSGELSVKILEPELASKSEETLKREKRKQLGDILDFKEILSKMDQITGNI